MQQPSVGTLPVVSRWQGRAIGLMDLDAFFASVEQLDHPEWRNLPVIVGGSADRRGVVATASYEARRFGVHSAMPSAIAEHLCPNAIWTRGDFARYREVSNQVMSILVDETPLVEQVSIDEAFFDITPGRFSCENPLEICRRIQKRVAQLGITCSIGLASNKTVAKIASERDKPRGLTVVPPGAEALFLAPLPVREMSGIGKAAESALSAIDVHTLGELAACDPSKMRQLFGVLGPRMVMRAAGRESSAVRPRAQTEEIKSISHERTFANDLTNAKDIRAAIEYVAALTGTRLRAKGLQGTEVTLKLKFDAAHVKTACSRLEAPTDDERAFGRVALSLLGEIWQPGMSIRLVGVAISRFGDACSRQMSLFEEDRTDHRNPRRDLRSLALATDEVKRRFGEQSIAYGHDLRLQQTLSNTTPKNKRDF
ncbi:MAG: DNA polymerase IV [Atopobiaceae bacterium]|jgi:DNA polymerase-4|nr:DNA polymerase IV [Olegusella sp.]